MYGSGATPLTMATAAPLSMGAMLWCGWIVMAVITAFFLVMSLYQLVRPSAAVRP
jgi:hypothetical protein